MTDRLLKIKSGITLMITALTSFLGWKGILALIWIAVMIIDYATGSIAAAKNGTWSSSAARDGIWHKAGMMVVITVAGITDLILGILYTGIFPKSEWSTAVLPVVMAWYILTELGSILENAVKMGTRVPIWLVRLLKQSLHHVDASATIEK